MSHIIKSDTYLVSFLQSVEIEQEIIALLLSSLKLCDTQTSNPQQHMFIVRSGLIYRYLGNIYVQSFENGCSSNARKRKLLSLCYLYYEKSVKLLEDTDEHHEYLAVQIDRLEFQKKLFQGRCETNRYFIS